MPDAAAPTEEAEDEDEVAGPIAIAVDVGETAESSADNPAL